MGRNSGGVRSRGGGGGSGTRTLGDYYKDGASSKLARRMNTIDKMESEFDRYTSLVERETGADTSRGSWSYDQDVYRQVFGNGFSYDNQRLQSEGFKNAVEKAVHRMTDRERATLVMAVTGNPAADKMYLNPNDGKPRSPIGPWNDDTAARSLATSSVEQRKKIFREWRQLMGSATYDGQFYRRRTV